MAAVGGVWAQDYPTRPIRWIIGFPPGGPTDILVRLMGERLQTRLGQPLVVENIGGAAGILGGKTCAQAAGDG